MALLIVCSPLTLSLSLSLPFCIVAKFDLFFYVERLLMMNPNIGGRLLVMSYQVLL